MFPCKGVICSPPPPFPVAPTRENLTAAFFECNRSRSYIKPFPRNPMADLLETSEIKQEMKRIPEWELLKNKSIERTFEFDDFTQAIDFVNAVAEIAEEEEHHPEMDIRYNR